MIGLFIFYKACVLAPSPFFGGEGWMYKGVPDLLAVLFAML